MKKTILIFLLMFPSVLIAEKLPASKAEGVFIAGCGEQCSRENTASWVHQRVEKVRKTLVQIDLEPERLQAFVLGTTNEDPAKELHSFVEQVGKFYLASVIMQEVKS